MQTLITQVPAAASLPLGGGKIPMSGDNPSFLLALAGAAGGETVSNGEGNDAGGKSLLELLAGTAFLTEASDSEAVLQELLVALDGLAGEPAAEEQDAEAVPEELPALEQALMQLDQLLIWLKAEPQVTAAEEGAAAGDPAADPEARQQMLQAEVKGALAELRTFLQSKNGSLPPEQTALVNQQLQHVKQLLEGKQGRQAEPAAKLPELAAAASFAAIKAQPAASFHLERWGHQLVSENLAAVLPVRGMKEAASVSGGMEQTQALQTDELPAAAIASPAAAEAGAVTGAGGSKPAPAAPAVPVQQFAKMMESLIVKQFKVSQGEGGSEARIALNPAHLGQVQVRIAVHNGQLTAMFVTDTAVAKDLLENQLVQLRAALQSQGMQVEKLAVAQNNFESNLFQERGGQQGRDQQGARRSRDRHDAAGESVIFAAEMNASEVEQAVNETLGYGRAISAKV